MCCKELCLAGPVFCQCNPGSSALLSQDVSLSARGTRSSGVSCSDCRYCRCIDTNWWQESLAALLLWSPITLKVKSPEVDCPSESRGSDTCGRSQDACPRVWRLHWGQSWMGPKSWQQETPWLEKCNAKDPDWARLSALPACFSTDQLREDQGMDYRIRFDNFGGKILDTVSTIGSTASGRVEAWGFCSIGSTEAPSAAFRLVGAPSQVQTQATSMPTLSYSGVAGWHWEFWTVLAGTWAEKRHHTHNLRYIP